MSDRDIHEAGSGLAVDISGLRVGYRRADGGIGVVIPDLDLRIPRGQFAAVVGESGSGKSTLAAEIIGLPSNGAARLQGTVRVAGASLDGRSERELARVRGRLVGLVPQDPGGSLNPVRRIGPQVAEVFRLRGERLSRDERRARTIRLLETAGIANAAERLRQYPHELSGGLKQRILIAMAFGLNPQVLVADEPTSALDVTVQKEVMAVFDRLVREHGTTVVFITHDLALAGDHADRLVVMRVGEIVEDGLAERVLREPSTAYATRLLENMHGRTQQPRARVSPRPVAEVAERGPAALSVEHLVKQFEGAGAPAVNDVSFSIPRGQTLSLVGESGSGKTTTARMALGLVHPTSGTIRLGEREVTSLVRSDRRQLWKHVQVVYQNPDSALDTRMSVREVIEEPLVHFTDLDAAARRDRVAELLEQVALPVESATRSTSALSGGQRQRVAIARALAIGSEIVVFDEALSALDVLTQEQIITLLDGLQRSLGLTYLFISHDLSVVRRISDQVVVMRAGGVVESGTAEEILSRPRTDYVRELVDAVPGRRFQERGRKTDDSHYEL